MVLVAGVMAALAAGTATGTDVDALQQLWSGVRDSSEQVVVSADPGISSWPETSERRVRAVVEPVALPWLGSHVLYLEEFLHDDPDNLRRQVLMKLEPAEPPARGVRARLFTFVKPRAWIHLNLRPGLLASLGSDDVAAASGCDLVFVREGDQFRGGTVGHRCLDARGAVTRYLDYQLLIGSDLYWYRRRLLLKGNGEVKEEVIGFNWFELDTTQLYTCRVDWASTGRPQDLRPLVKLDVQDQGGHGRFVTPDGRKIELTLHSDDWPFAVERDALILVVQDQGAEIPFATAWSSTDEEQISIDLSWLRIRCGPTVPDADEMRSDGRTQPPAMSAVLSDEPS
ncbi:MAG: CpeT/CpcT family [Gammaproteobacteria bacterium]|nr:CpeT/CpcT family [Gammaproteobacteria bacterium]